MTGKSAATPSILTRPVVLTAVAVAFVSAAAAGAWLTRPPAEAPPRVAKNAKSRLAAAPAQTPMATPASAPATPPQAAPPKPADSETARPASAPPEPAAGLPKPVDWSAVPIAALRAKAEAGEIAAMEELARRLVQGIGVAKDQQAGAGWLLRAAQAGSPQSAFNVGVMYERGFVVERDSQRAVEWYRKAVEANLPMAKHNLALLLRDGKGVARNGREAVELLRSATRQGMAASMFTLGDIHERGDAAPKDPATALAWFAITAEFERQMNKGADTQLAKTASQRAQTLQRVLTPAELEKAQQLGQSEFKQIVEALQPPKPPPAPAPPAAPPPVETAAAPAPPPPDPDPPGWPKAANDQVRAIQQALLDLKLLRDKPDGVMGPVTRAAIRTFQKSVGMRETGEPSKELYVATKDALAAKRDFVANPPPPPPAKVSTEAKPEPATEPPKPEPPRVDAPKVEAAPVASISIPLAPPPPPVEFPKQEANVEPPKAGAAKPAPAPATATVEPTKADPPKPVMPRIETEKPPALQIVAKPEPAPAPPPPAVQPAAPPKPLEIGKPDPPPPPPTSADIARATPPPAKADPDAWPAQAADQVKVVQALLHEMNFYRDTPDGRLGPATRAAIREYERLSGLKVTGEPNKDVFESLKEMRLLMKPKAAAGSN